MASCLQHEAAAKTLGNQSTCSFPFLTVQGVEILPDLETLQLPLWVLLKKPSGGSVGSARAGGLKARVLRAPSDCHQERQTSYDITQTAHGDFCFSRLLCFECREFLALSRTLSQSEGDVWGRARRWLPT